MLLCGLARETVIYTVGNGTRGIAALLALPIYTFFLAPPEFAIIALLTVFGIVVRALAGLGFSISTAVVYFRSEDVGHRAATIQTALVASVAAALLLVIVGVVLGGPISSLLTGSAAHGEFVALFAAAIALQQIAYPLIWRLQFRARPIRYVLAFSGGTLIGIVASVVLVADGRGITGWVEGAVIGSVAMLAIAYLFNHDIASVRPRGDNLRAQLRLGLPIVPSLLFIFVLQGAGTYLLQFQAGLDAVGVYGIGYNFGLAMSLIVASFIAAWTPFFQAYTTREPRAPATFARVHLLYTLAIGGFVLLFFAAAQPAVLALTEPGFHEAYRVIGTLAAAHALIGTWSLLAPGLYFSGRTYMQTVIQGIGALAAVVLTWVLIPRIGIDGAALAMAAGTLLMCALLALHNNARGYPAMAYRLRPTVIAIAVIAIGGGLQRLLDETLSLGVAALGSVVILAAYAAIAWALLAPEDRDRFRLQAGLRRSS